MRRRCEDASKRRPQIIVPDLLYPRRDLVFPTAKFILQLTVGLAALLLSTSAFAQTAGPGAAPGRGGETSQSGPTPTPDYRSGSSLSPTRSRLPNGQVYIARLDELG
jgi:hypothetical protein